MMIASSIRTIGRGRGGSGKTGKAVAAAARQVPPWPIQYYSQTIIATSHAAGADEHNRGTVGLGGPNGTTTRTRGPATYRERDSWDSSFKQLLYPIHRSVPNFWRSLSSTRIDGMNYAV